MQPDGGEVIFEGQGFVVIEGVTYPSEVPVNVDADTRDRLLADDGPLAPYPFRAVEAPKDPEPTSGQGR